MPTRTARTSSKRKARPAKRPSRAKPPDCNRGVGGLKNLKPQPLDRNQGALFRSPAASRALDFFPRFLRHTKGRWAGQPLALSPWQQSLIATLFGTLGPDGHRQYRTCYVEVPRKNGKSTLAAGVALYLLFADREPGAEIYSAAADRDQAAITFDAARAMIEAAPALRSRAKLYRRAIEVPRSGAVYRALSAEAYTKHGLSAHGIIFDEVHAQKSRDLWDTLTTSTGARRQPLTLAITTAGHDRHSICWELHEHARQVSEGTITDPTFLPVIHAAPMDADWSDPAVIAAANPSVGDAIGMDYLLAARDRAQQTPGAENAFRRLHLCQWTEQQTRWLPLAAWDDCHGGVIDPAALAGRVCYAGLDLGSTRDLTALVLAFPGREASAAGAGAPGSDEPITLLPFFWCPKATVAERSRADHVPYDQWVRAGHLVATDSGHGVTDYGVIRRAINDLAQRYQIRALAIDRLFQGVQMGTDLAHDGLEVEAMGQGFYSLAGPTRRFEELVLAKGLRHGGNPILRWMVGNAQLEQDAAGNGKPSKAKSGDKIDGVVASVMALALLERAAQEGGHDVFFL